VKTEWRFMPRLHGRNREYINLPFVVPHYSHYNVYVDIYPLMLCHGKACCFPSKGWVDHQLVFKFFLNKIVFNVPLCACVIA
jgi:hypothetical protein